MTGVQTCALPICRIKWVKEIDHGLYEMGIEFMHEIPGSIMSLISHLFRKQTNIPAVIHS